METEIVRHSVIDEDLKLALQLEAELNKELNFDKNKNDEIENTKNSNTEIKSNKKKKNRCHNCNIKTGMLGFSCKCGGSYCSKCRYPDTHICDFDWKAENREILKKNNPKIVSDKLNRL